MPIYEYECPFCNDKKEEVIMPGDIVVPPLCLKCSQVINYPIRMDRIMSSPAIAKLKEPL